jgi:glycosyltransferase involved in cell wall biosynthesis
MNNMSPKVSVILPVFNGEKYISEAVTSVINQDFFDFELIVVDDCSSDTTFQKIIKITKNDSRIKLIRNKHNMGLPASLNIGFASAKGQFLTWTSHDNRFKTNYLSTMTKELENNCDFVYSNYNLIDVDGRDKEVKITQDYSNLIFGNCIGASFMYTKKLSLEIGEYDENKFMFEDYDYWVRIWLNGAIIHRIDRVLYDYRVHPGQLTNQIKMPKSYLSFRKNIILKSFNYSNSENRCKAAIRLLPLAIRNLSVLNLISLLRISFLINYSIAFKEIIKLFIEKFGHKFE